MTEKIQQYEFQKSKTNLNENCADVSPRRPSITKCIGCTPAKLGQYPWQVALVKIDAVKIAYYCGGTLISTGLVLTAAHCVTYERNVGSIIVILGHIDKTVKSQQTITKGMIKKTFLLY